MIWAGVFFFLFQAQPEPLPEEAVKEVLAANKALAAKDYERAIPHLEKAVELLGELAPQSPVLAEMNYNLIVCFQKTGQSFLAVKTAKAWLKKHPQDADVLELWGKLAFLRGDYDEAAKASVSYTHLTLPTNREV